MILMSSVSSCITFLSNHSHHFYLVDDKTGGKNSCFLILKKILELDSQRLKPVIKHLLTTQNTEELHIFSFLRQRHEAVGLMLLSICQAVIEHLLAYIFCSVF